MSLNLTPGESRTIEDLLAVALTNSYQGDMFFFYASRLDGLMSKRELLVSDAYYARYLDRIGGMAGEW